MHFGRCTMKVFISWSGALSKELGESLRDWIPVVLQAVNPYFTPSDVEKGTRWSTDIARELEGSSIGILCVTRENINSPWMLFEAGALSKSLEKSHVCPMLFGITNTDLAGPLKQFQTTAFDKSEVKQLLTVINNQIPEGKLAAKTLETVFEKWWPDLDEKVNSILSKVLRPKDELDSISHDMVKRIIDLPDNPLLQSNPWMRKILSMSLRRAFESINTGSRHVIPAVHYPMYLDEFQQKHNARVRALAFLEREEFFWLLELGNMLAKHAHHESQRIFIFDNVDQLEKYQEILRLHALKYKVFAISRDTIAKIIPVSKDFSIIMDKEDKQQAVLAEYDSSQTVTVVRFDFDQGLINHHLGLLDEVQRAAVEIPRSDKVFDKSQRDGLRNNIFGPFFVQYTRLPVEMSEYISVADYDQHEEKHAYYIDMLSEIIDILLKNRKQRSMTKCRILEFGAGTGILSTRLASISNSEIHVVEIDWACYQVLVGKFRQNGAKQLEVSADNRQHRFEMPNGNSVVTHNEDSRFYNPVGSYDYIVTSFADHHIKASDKQLYFANVKQNLNEGALFIVGDEFLREHDPTDENAWRDAVLAYHGHIIEIALTHGETELANLERQAMQSGLDRRGDFKLSLTQYVAQLQSSGFKVESRCIGPSDTSLTGGVYVCTANYVKQ